MTTVSGASPSTFNVSSALTTGSTGNPVTQTSDAGMAQTAVSLSAEAGVVATLGGGGLSPMTYSAAGLLNILTQAGPAPSSTQTTDSSTNPQTAAQNSTDQGVVGTLPTNAVTSGTYNSSGALNALSSDLSANWASILKTAPSFSSSVISDSLNLGIVGTLSTTA